jgi:hypothetical protein
MCTPMTARAESQCSHCSGDGAGRHLPGRSTDQHAVSRAAARGGELGGGERGRWVFIAGRPGGAVVQCSVQRAGAQRYRRATGVLSCRGRARGGLCCSPAVAHRSLAGWRFNCRRRSGGLGREEPGTGAPHTSRRWSVERGAAGPRRARQSAAGEPCSKFRRRS